MNVKWVTAAVLLLLLLLPAVAVAIGSNTCGGSAATVVLNDSGFNAGAITFGLGVIAGDDIGTSSRSSSSPAASGSPLPSPMPTRSVAPPHEDLTLSVASQSQCALAPEFKFFD